MGIVSSELPLDWYCVPGTPERDVRVRVVGQALGALDTAAAGRVGRGGQAARVHLARHRLDYGAG